MARDAAAFRAHVERIAPAWMQDLAPGAADALLHGLAAIWAEVEGALETQHGRGFIQVADGAWLDAHGKERNVRRLSGESDTSYSDRIRQFDDAVTRDAILAAVDSMLGAGQARMHEFRRDGAFLCGQGATVAIANPTDDAVPIALTTPPVNWWTWWPYTLTAEHIPFGTRPTDPAIKLPIVPGTFVATDLGLGQVITDSDNGDGTGDLIGDVLPSATSKIHYATGELLVAFATATSGPVTFESSYPGPLCKTLFLGQYLYEGRPGFRLFLPRQGVAAIVGNAGFLTAQGSGAKDSFLVANGSGSNEGAMFLGGVVPNAADLYRRIVELVERIRAAGIDAEYLIDSADGETPQSESDFA